LITKRWVTRQKLFLTSPFRASVRIADNPGVRPFDRRGGRQED
jgi:hypothetical protein